MRKTQRDKPAAGFCVGQPAADIDAFDDTLVKKFGNASIRAAVYGYDDYPVVGEQRLFTAVVMIEKCYGQILFECLKKKCKHDIR